MRWFSFFAVYFVICFNVAEAKVLELSSFELDNGLEVVVVENHKAPVALQMLFYKTGSVNDPKGKGGLAHLLEHLMFRGTKRLKDKEFNRLTDEFGASNNAYTTYDKTVYYEFADISKLELMMALEADRMRGLKLDNETFLKERDIVLQERMQRFESNPVPLFYEMMRKVLWQEHPFANAVSGSPFEIKNLAVDDVKNFYDEYYYPDNALLVLSGDITVSDAKELAEKYYGDIDKGYKNYNMELPKARDFVSDMEVFLKGVEQPRFVSYYRFDKGDISKVEALALDIFSEYLTGDDTAILYDELVYQDKKLLSVSSSFNFDKNFGGSWEFYATPYDNKTKIDDIKLFIAQKMVLALEKLNDDELNKIKNRVLSDMIYLQENPESAANFVGLMLVNGFSVDEIENYDKNLADISVDDIRNAWNKVMNAKVKITGYLDGEGL